MKITRKQLIKLLKESLTLSFMSDATQEEKDPWASDVSSSFTNELGNDIEIDIKDFGCGSANQLTISIIGPNSETENTITRMEAEELHRLLGNYLSNTNASIE